MIDLILLGTEYCHLCDEAEQELESQRLFSKIPYQITVRDIIDDPQLFESYRETIPVVINRASGKELNYPFTFAELMTFLEGCKDS